MQFCVCNSFSSSMQIFHQFFAYFILVLLFLPWLQFSLMYLQATRNMRHATCNMPETREAIAHNEDAGDCKLEYGINLCKCSVGLLYFQFNEVVFNFKIDDCNWQCLLASLLYVLYAMQWFVVVAVHEIMKYEPERKQSADKVSLHTYIDK